MRLNFRSVAAVLAVAVLAAIGLGLVVPAALGARGTDARVGAVVGCRLSEKGARVTIDVSALLRDSRADISVELRDEAGNTPVIEGQPDVAGLFRDTAEGETGLGRHQLILTVTTGADQVLHLESAVELSASNCVEGNRLFVGNLSWNTSE